MLDGEVILIRFTVQYGPGEKNVLLDPPSRLYEFDAPDTVRAASLSMLSVIRCRRTHLVVPTHRLLLSFRLPS